MLGPNDLPFAVTGERCLIMEHPPKERSEGGLYMPDTAKERYYSGTLLDAGLQARDKLYDAGVNIGDRVEFGRYAGLREVWDRVIEGDHTKPDDAYKWSPINGTLGVQRRYKCDKTGAIRSLDSVIILNVDDLIASWQLAERFRNGSMKYVRGKTAEGATQFVVERNE